MAHCRDIATRSRSSGSTNHMGELGSQAAGFGNPVGPVHDGPVPVVPPHWKAICLVHSKGVSIAQAQPRSRHDG
jgi:hypothetical protein